MIRTITQVSPAKKIPRPNDSRIQIRTSDKTLEIYVPSLISGGLYINQPVRGIKILLLIPILIGAFSVVGSGAFIVISYFLGVDIASISDVSIFHPKILMSLSPCLLFVSLVLHWLTVGSQTRFDRHRFKTNYEIFGLSLYQRGGITSNITGVLIRSTYNNGTQIFIQVGSESYYLQGSFMEAECLWLVQEIQDWLAQ